MTFRFFFYPNESGILESTVPNIRWFEAHWVPSIELFGMYQTISSVEFEVYGDERRIVYYNISRFEIFYDPAN